MTAPAAHFGDVPLSIDGGNVVLTLSPDQSRLLSLSLADGQGTNDWVDDLVHALRAAEGRVTPDPQLSRGAYFRTLFAEEPKPSQTSKDRAHRLDAAVGRSSAVPSQMATLAAHALASTFEARSTMMQEVERLIAAEALSAEVAVTVAATRTEEAAVVAQSARSAATAQAADAIVETVSRTAAEVKVRADASASRVADAAALTADVVRAALETHGVDPKDTAAKVARIVASAAADNAKEAHLAAIKVADDAIAAAFDTAAAAAEADIAFDSAVGLAAEAAQADADASASQLAFATQRSRRIIAATGRLAAT